MSDVNEQDKAAIEAAIKYSESRLSSLELAHKKKYGRLHGEEGHRESETEEAFLAGVKWARENPIRVEKNPDEVLDHPCKNTCSGWAQGYEAGKILQRNPEEPVVELIACSNCERVEESLRMAVEALKKISLTKNYTRLAGCCVDKTCHTHDLSGSCSFQTGVYYANGDRAGEADEALAKIEALGNLQEEKE